MPPPLPEERRRRSGRGLLIGNGVLAGLVFAVLVFIVPVFGAMFADFGAKLPRPTQFLLDLSDVVKAWWWLLWLPIAAGVIVGYRWLGGPGNPRAADRYLVGALIAQILFVVYVIVAMFMPIFQLGAVAAG